MKKEELFKIATEKLSEKKYAEAIDLFQQLYMNEPNLENNYRLFQALNTAQKYQDAILVANDYFKDYLKEDIKFFEYLTVLLHAGKIIDVFELFNNLNQYLSDEEKAQFKMKLKHYNDYLNDKQRMKIKEIIRKLKYLGAYSVEEQNKILKQINLLNPQELYLNTKDNLINSDIPVITRASLLDVLRKVSKNNIEFLTFDNRIIKIDLSKLLPIGKFLNYQKLVKMIFDSKKITENLKLKIISEVKLKMMLMYPELDQIPLDVLVKLTLNTDESLNTKELELKKKLDAEINKIDIFKN